MIATIIPIATNRTIATCIQIQLRGTASIVAGMAGCQRDDRDGLLRKLLLVSALALCAAAWLAPAGMAAQPSRMATAQAARGGVNILGIYTGARPAEADREIATARALHAHVVRAQVPWSVLEPSAAGQIEPRAQAFLDRLVSDAAAQGIGVIATVDFTPCWASSAPPRVLLGCAAGNGTSKANAWPPRHPADYAAFTAYLAARYGTRLTAIEVWNEPDQANERYLAGPNKPQRYAALLRAAYPAIKHANHRVSVLGGSLVGSNGVFLRALYAAGIAGYYDGLAVHFYDLTLASLRAIHEVQLAAGDSKPLWLDEFGWTSCWPQQRIQQEQACVTRAVQAQNITSTMRALVRTPYVAAEVLYGLQDGRDEDFGVLSSSGARKPAFAALSSVLRAPFAGAPRAVTLALRAAHGHVQASGTGPTGDYLQLEAFQGTTLRYRALFTLDRFNRYLLTLPAALGTSGLTVHVYQYWTGAGHDAQRSI